MAGLTKMSSFVTVQGDKDHEELEMNPNRGSGHLVPDAFRGATSFRGNRKKRMPRQRRVSMDTLLYALSSTSKEQRGMASQRRATMSTSPVALSSTSKEQQEGKLIRPACELDPTKLRFLLQKELRQSDVNALGRIVLPKTPCEEHLPTLSGKEGTNISMDDMNGSRVWSFKYRYWPNNKSRMYVLEHTGEFVKKHGLKTGDYVMLYKDDQNKKFIIRAKKSLDQDAYYDHMRNGYYDANGQLIQEYEVNRSNYYPFNYPMVDVMSMPVMFNDPDLGGQMTKYSELDPLTSFGSVDNISLDDFA